MTTSETAVAAASESAKSHLLEESILPLLQKQRNIGSLGFVYIWIGIAVIIATFQLGATGVEAMPLPRSWRLSCSRTSRSRCS